MEHTAPDTLSTPVENAAEATQPLAPDDADDDNCVICLDALTALPQHSVACGHTFHAACYSRCVVVAADTGTGVMLCPLCRRVDREAKAPLSLKRCLKRCLMIVDKLIPFLMIACMLGYLISEHHSATGTFLRRSASVMMYASMFISIILRYL